MLRNPLTWLLLLTIASALAACCGSVACDCQDNQDDALFFRFNLDSLNADSMGFRAAKLRTVFIRRVPLDTAQRPRADTITVTGGRRNLVQEVVINNAQPFAQSGTRKLDRYTYQIYLGTRRVPTLRYLITNVLVRDTLTGDGCCSCNLNTQKKLTLDGQALDLADPNRQDQPVYVPLNRKR